MTDEKVVRDVVDNILEEKNYKRKDLKINPISTEGANYTSALYTISVKTDVEDLELFAKVAIIGDEMRKQVNADMIFQTERTFYTRLVKIYDDLQDKHQVPEEHRYVFPKCYGFNSESGHETVVMENLAVKGYEPFNRFNTMDWEHAALSLEVLAKFHALSFAFAKEKPEEFEELASKLVRKTGSSEEPDEAMIAIWVQMVDRAVSVIDEQHRETIREQMMEKDLMNKYTKPISKPVLVHGDYRLSNILFRRKSETLEAIPVDYQLVHSGCVATDLLYFIFLGSDDLFRRQHYSGLLKHYYDHLCQAMRRLDVDPVEAYPNETFISDTAECLPYVLLLGVVILPIITVEAEQAPKMSENNLESFMNTHNALYASRFRGIVDTCVRLGVL